MHNVIIIGGGPVGLSAAICLAHQGIESVLIEKHPTTTNHPKARGVNGRSMELFRSWGLEDQMKQYQMPREAYRFTWLEDFQGREITRVQATVDYSPYSPTENAIIAQDDVEKELFKQAQSMPLIDLRFNTEMIHATQNENQVTVDVLNKNTNQKETLSAQYLIAADGASSPLRKLFNIEMEGMENLGVFCNIYCEMDLGKYVEHRPSVGFMFTRPDLQGTFILSKKDHKKWLVGVRLDPNRNLTKELFTDDFCVEFIKKIINDPQVEVRLINKAFWTMAALIANQYRLGRLFLAGDAAHRLPPTGGFGMNTGIQDVHNLAWKLAMVIKGQADDSLLDTYFTERVQIAKTNMLWSMSNAKRFETIFIALEKKDLKTVEEALKDQAHHINNILLDLGFIYGSEYHTQNNYKPTAEVGARAPHCWLMKDKKQISTLDLYDNQFVLVCHPDARLWRDKYRQFPCKIVTIGEQGDYSDKNHDFLEKYAISKQGAVLVRPDGHIAWCSRGEDAKMANFWFELANIPQEKFTPFALQAISVLPQNQVWRPPNKVRCKVIGLAKHDKKLLVVEVLDDQGNLKGWCPIGGGIEFGEKAEDALIREINEELKCNITIIGEPIVCENIFEHHGCTGHEIIFAFPIKLSDQNIYRNTRFQIREERGSTHWVEWVPIERFEKSEAILFPSILINKLKELS